MVSNEHESNGEKPHTPGPETGTGRYPDTAVIDAVPQTDKGVVNSPKIIPVSSDDLHLLKMRIQMLEEQAAARPVAPENARTMCVEGDTHPAHKHTEESEFLRLQDCLYKHRRQWEATVGPGNWLQRPDYSGHWLGLGSTGVSYTVRDQQREYKRPDPFDPKHDCTGVDTDAGEPDEFDIAVDFQARRERLRKGFDWEMDRLHLMEELDNRRVQKEKAKQESEQEDKQDLQAAKSATQTADNGSVLPTEPEPMLSRMDWDAFRRPTVGKIEGCKIDILMGEPIVHNDLYPTYGWYSARPSRRHRGKTNLPAGRPEEGPLPERIRVYSPILQRIIGKMLGSDGESLTTTTGPSVVFIRPFKALVYCERALREVCMRLERNATVSSSEEAPSSGKQEDALIQAPSAAPMSNTAAASERVEPESYGDSGDPAMHGHDEEDDDDEDTEEENEIDEDSRSPTTLKHVRCLLEFFDTDLAQKRAHINDPLCRKVFFSDLWHLYHPGMEVIGRDGKQAYRVVDVSSASHRVIPAWQRWKKQPDDKKTKPPFSVTCVHIDFDGKSLGPVLNTFEIKRFEGQREITSLEVYPLRLNPLRKSDFGDYEWKEIETLSPAERSDRNRQRLITRGRKFLTVADVKHMYYAGPSLGVREEVESQVVIDAETAFTSGNQEQQEWKPTLDLLVGNFLPDEEDEEEACQSSCCRHDQVYDDYSVDRKRRTEYVNSLLPTSEGSDEQPSIAIVPRSLKDLKAGPDHTVKVSEDELLIMSYRVFGFVLRSRKWAQLDLSYLVDIDNPGAPAADLVHPNADESKPKTAFERLVIEENHKKMIVSLVDQHFRDKGSKNTHTGQVDIVRGKGKGLILLLHGAPGVGKTSTAEGVAEQFRKPLFQITCGDLGTTAKEVEKALETTFTLANRWECILLLDEADVFLAQRTKEDFQRNGLVAVFLRVMEYYDGILFLTTNRVGDFDEAFTSRIHISLYYPALDSRKTTQIFHLNLQLIEDRFRQQGRRIKIDHYDIAAFAANLYNGDSPTKRDTRWNGRQIRNSCQTALALAEHDAQVQNPGARLQPDVLVELKEEHFQTVRDVYMEFTTYIDDLYGADNAERAQEGRLRTLEKHKARKSDHAYSFAQDIQNPSVTSHHAPSGYRNQPPPPAMNPRQFADTGEPMGYAHTGHLAGPGPLPPANIPYNHQLQGTRSRANSAQSYRPGQGPDEGVSIPWRPGTQDLPAHNSSTPYPGSDTWGLGSMHARPVTPSYGGPSYQVRSGNAPEPSRWQ